QDLGIGGELNGYVPGGEADLHLLPERIETVALDGVEHAREVTAGDLPSAGVAHVDRVDRPVVCEQRLLGRARFLLEVDREYLTVIEGRHLAGGAVHAAGPGRGTEDEQRHDRRWQGEHPFPHSISSRSSR